MDQLQFRRSVHVAAVNFGQYGANRLPAGRCHWSNKKYQSPCSSRSFTWRQNHIIAQGDTQPRCAVCGKKVTHKVMWHRASQVLLQSLSLAWTKIIVVYGDKNQSIRTFTVQTMVITHLEIVLHAILLRQYKQSYNVDNLYDLFTLCTCDDYVFVNIQLNIFVFCRKEWDYNKPWAYQCSPGLSRLASQK